MLTNSLFFLVLHSFMRWLVLLSLLYAIYRAWLGYTRGRAFTKADNRIRHQAATIAHIQLLLGMTLYIQSSNTSYFWHHFRDAIQQRDPRFFGLIHIFLMLTAIVLITLGSALAKRREDDIRKFKTMLLWFGAALIIILAAIPWPFSPLAARPYLRNF